MSRYRSYWRDQQYVNQMTGGESVCPWCGWPPVGKLWEIGKFESGSREAKRALRKGRARVRRLVRGSLNIDEVVCAHACHI